MTSYLDALRQRELLNKCIDSSISSSKLLNKPPKKPSHPSNDLNRKDSSKSNVSFKTPSKNESETDNYIHLNQMLERFRYSKPLSKDERPKLSKSNFWWAKQSIENGHDSEKTHGLEENRNIDLKPKDEKKNNDDEEEDDSIKEESQEILSLCKRLNKLRKELYNKNKNEADSIDNFASQSVTGLENDELNESTPSSHGSQTPTESFDEQVSTYKDSEKKHPAFYSINKQKISNTDSFDFKTNNLIKKSESSLSDRVLSSDGSESSQLSFSSSSIITNASSFQDTQPHKPEFVKYLENKEKNKIQANGEQIKPEDDILYQWRLRRKLEETRQQVMTANTIANRQTSITNNQTLQQNNGKHVDQNLEEKGERVKLEDEIKTAQISDKTSSVVKSADEKIKDKMSAQTQTSTLVDSSVQTSIESALIIPSAKSKTILEHNSAYAKEVSSSTSTNEIPTKDYNSHETNHHNKRNSKSSKSKRTVLASSPVQAMRDEHNLTGNFKSTNSSTELTRISTISNDYTPRHSFSPPITSNKTISKSKKQEAFKTKSRKKSASPFERKSSTSTTTSTISSFSSSITNITMQTQIHATTATNRNTNDLDKTLENADNNQSLSLKEKESHFDFDSMMDSYFKDDDKEMYESDEILQILFKKTYFYQMKLKQIDELLTN